MAIALSQTSAFSSGSEVSESTEEIKNSDKKTKERILISLLVFGVIVFLVSILFAVKIVGLHTKDKEGQLRDSLPSKDNKR